MVKTFVLGLGAQKCGTSWLYKYMSQSRNFKAGLWKEYHVWDAIYIPLLSRKRMARKLFMKKKKRLLYKMQRQPDVYFKYFDALLSEDGAVTADITPSYSGLSQAALKEIKQGFERREIRCKAVFFMRDPVERCRSAVRMNLVRMNRGKGHLLEGITEGNIEFCDALREYYQSEHAKIRTRYDDTIKNIRTVFGSDEYYIGIYESMFREENLVRLSEFLGVEQNTGFAQTVVNKARGHKERCENLELEIRDYYSDVYSFCFDEFPETRELWTA